MNYFSIFKAFQVQSPCFLWTPACTGEQDGDQRQGFLNIKCQGKSFLCTQAFN